MLQFLIDVLFGTLYGSLLFAVAVLAAVPYGIWQGLKRLGRLIGGGSRGNDGTSR
ncbi:MAG: hypothetical protein ACKVVT_15815 [Dehalococcoidia bacterium]